MATIQQITAGMTGEEVAELLYNNDQGLNVEVSNKANLVAKNLFDKTAVVSGYYVDYVHGVYPLANGVLSPWIDLDPAVNVYYLSGRNNSFNGIAFQDASGTQLKPVNADGSPKANYNLGYLNGIVYKPAGAVKVCFSVKDGPLGTFDAIQFERGNAQTEYSEYGNKLIPIEEIPFSVEQTTGTSANNTMSQNAITNELSTKPTMDEYGQIDITALPIVVNKNLFDKTAVVSGYYVDYVHGVYPLANGVLSPWIDLDPAVNVYYLSGRNNSFNGIAFQDASGTQLKPVNADGSPKANYNLGYLNGIVYKPAGAVKVCFSVKDGPLGTFDAIQFERGNAQTEYSEYGDYKIDESYLPPADESRGKFKIVRSNKKSIITTKFNAQYDIQVTVDEYVNTNGVMNIYDAKLVDTSTQAIKQLNGASTDDAAPVFMNGMYIGGNHGSAGGRRVTSAAHGKTLADVGSIWQDAAGVKWYILQIIDVNTILIISENLSTTGSWQFKTAPSTSLTYVSNGTNTANIPVTATSSVQIYPSVKNLKQDYVIDGTTDNNNGVFKCDTFSIVESYDIIDTPTMVALVVANRPVGGYSVQPSFAQGDSIVSIRNIYDFKDKNTCIVSWSFIARKDIFLDRFYGTQSALIKPTWITSYKRYIPSMLPILIGAKTWDFRTKEDLSTLYTSNFYITPAYFEDAKRPFRIIDILESVDTNINFNIGIAPIATPVDDVATNAWYTLATGSPGKIYPIVFDAKITSGGIMAANTIVQGGNFRGWAERTAERTNLFAYTHANKSYVFIDWHTVVNDLITLPSEMIGKRITKIEKSNNVTIFAAVSDTVTSSIDITVGVNTPQYGYCFLVIE